MALLLPVKYRADQKYIKLEEVDGEYSYPQFLIKVVERFCLPSDANFQFKDETGTQVDEAIFNDLLHQRNIMLTAFCDDEFSDSSFSSTSDLSEVSWSSGSSSTIIVQGPPKKQPRFDYASSTEATSAKELIEGVLKERSGGDEVLKQYQEIQTLHDATRRQMVNILVSHMMEHHGHIPSKATREKYALGIVMAFPSLKDPYTKRGYEHFYDPASGTGYLAWRLKTVQRHTKRPRCIPSNVGQGGPSVQRNVTVTQQLDSEDCQEVLSLLQHTTDSASIFQQMRKTFLYRQQLINDPGRSTDVLSIFSRYLDTKGLVNQDFTLLFDEDTSTRLLMKWDLYFKQGVVREAKQLVLTPELQSLIESAESPPGSETAFDSEMASLLLLLHLLPPPPGGPKSPKISASEATKRLIIFHKSCCSLEEHLRCYKREHPYILAVGQQPAKIDNFYITLDSHLIPCQATRALGAIDELFKCHFVFNLSYDSALVNLYTFIQTTVFNIDVGKMKESPRVKELRAKLLNQTLTATVCVQEQ